MRIDGYLPIRDYALIGDGRTMALVGRDGVIDWLCLPNVDSPSVFGALLDAERGGSFVLQPSVPFESFRRYVPNTNVLETTYRTDLGVVRTREAMTLPDAHLGPSRELVREVEGLSGGVPMRWRFAPRVHYGSQVPRFEWRLGMPVAIWSGDAVALCHWNAGIPEQRNDGIEGTFELAAGRRALLALALAHAEPLVLPGRLEVAARLEKTAAFWSRWTATRTYEGPWPDAVRRSALVLKLLIFAPSGATAAAPTTSVPEEIGGARNWDYRYCWIRDANFMIDALLEIGCYDEARSLFWWFLHATAQTEPELHVMYRLDGGLVGPERSLPMAGYRHSVPVRIGNRAAEQLQLDIYGAVLQTAWLYCQGGHQIEGATAAVFARIANAVCDIWRKPDSGIWEVRNGPFQFTHSKAMCWVALDRARRLAEAGALPSAHARRWTSEAAAIVRFIEDHCWSETLHSYTRFAGGDRVDASLLMLPMMEYGNPRGERTLGTIDAISRELGHGDFVYRYLADDGVPGGEGCFLNCSFWLVSALAHAGRIDEASALMDRLVARANDVGLYSEEIDPVNGDFLGNFPQALVHLALIDAAVAIKVSTKAPVQP